MRIGEINRDNYKMFLSMLGAKSTKTLDAIFGDGTDKNANSNFHTDDKYYGSEEGMRINGDVSWKRTVPVSDEIRTKLIETARKHILNLANGDRPSLSGKHSDELSAILKEYRKNIPPNERLPVTWTLCNIYTDEQRRLIDLVKSKDPTYVYGQRFDKDILLKSDFGANSVDVKA